MPTAGAGPTTTTTAPPDATTTAPAGTTTAAPEATTTEGPPTTTTAPPEESTTAAPGSTTTEAPSTTTTAPPDGSTTAAPDGSTTAPDGSTTAPEGSTTAGGGPTVEEVTVDIDPDDGADHHATSIQVSTDAKLTLNWSTQNATGVRIEGLGDLEASGSSPIPTEDRTWSVVAVGDGGAESKPYLLEVHTHAPDEVVSAHVEIGSGVAKLLSFAASVDGQPATSAAAGASVELQVVASDGVESVTVEDQEVELADTGDGHKSGSVTLTAPDGASEVTWTCKAMKDGAEADSISLTLSLGAPGTTTAPSSTTTAGGDWTAAWSEEQASAGKTLQMVLTAPGLAAGTEVTFEVRQEGVDAPIGTATATAEEGKATADWSGWFKPEAVGDRQKLDGDQGEAFKAASFAFKASASGKSAESGAATYSDRLHVQLVDHAGAPLAKGKALVLSPWGSLSVTAGDDGVIDLQGIPPGGAHVVPGDADASGASPGNTTTAAPASSTTAPPSSTTTAAPATTTTAPGTTTTAAPATTTTAAAEWTAGWSAKEAQAGATLRMQLTAQGVAAGTEVTFEVSMDGVGVVGQVTASAEDGSASADWSDWFNPDLAASLVEGSGFKPATFSFKATAGSRSAQTSEPATYADRIWVKLVDGKGAPLAGAQVTVHTAWGDLAVTAGADGVVDVSVPPGGAHLAAAGGVGMGGGGS